MPATPSEPTYQCAHAASTTPPTIKTGSHSIRQRRDRQLIAHPSTTTVIICTAAGSQPWTNDR